MIEAKYLKIGNKVLLSLFDSHLGCVGKCVHKIKLALHKKPNKGSHTNNEKFVFTHTYIVNKGLEIDYQY